MAPGRPPPRPGPRRRRSRGASALLLVCGRYEGIDERVRELGLYDEEISLGDFVLPGGEAAALALTEAVSRLVPGVVGRGGVARERVLPPGAAGLSRTTRGPREFRGLDGARRSSCPATTARIEALAPGPARSRARGSGGRTCSSAGPPSPGEGEEGEPSERPGSARTATAALRLEFAVSRIAAGIRPTWDLESLAMTDLLLEVEKASLKSDIPAFAPGDCVRVHVKVREGEKERIQLFAGVVIARRGGGRPRDVHGPQDLGRRRASSASSRSTRRSSTASRSSAGAPSAAPSSTTSASARARPRASTRSRPTS